MVVVNKIDPALKKQIVYHINETTKLLKKARRNRVDEVNFRNLSPLEQDDAFNDELKTLILIRETTYEQISKIASISGKSPEEAIESLVKELFRGLQEDGVLI